MYRSIIFLLFTLKFSSVGFAQNIEATTHIYYGTNLESEISSYGEIDYYTFYGKQGDVILLRMRDEFLVDSYLKLFDPDKKLIISKWSDGGLAQIKDFTLPSDGLYTIHAFDRNHNDIGRYGLSLHQLNHNEYSRTLPDIISLTDSISTIVGVNSYQVNVTEGDMLFAQMRAHTEHFECDFLIYKESGEQIYRATNSGRLATVGPVKIQEAGKYTIFILDRGGNDLDSYGFTFMLLNKHESAPLLTCNDNVSGTINQLTERKAYKFTSSESGFPLFEIRSLDKHLEGTIEVFDEEGNRLGSVTKSNQLVSLMAPYYKSQKSFLLVISDKNGNDFGKFGLQAYLLSEEGCIEEITCDEPERPVDVVNLAHGKLFSIYGYLNENMNITLKETSSHLEPQLRLFDTLGNLIAQKRDPIKASLDEYTYPYTGLYYLIASDQSGNDIGVFELSTPLNSMALDMPECITMFHGFDPLCEKTISSGLTGSEYSYQWSTGETSPSISVCMAESGIISVEVSDQNGCMVYGETFIDVINVNCGNAANPKIQICHVDENSGKLKDKCIAEEGVWGHLDNGIGHDGCFLGPCDLVTICNPEIKTIRNENIEARSAGSLLNARIFPNPSSDIIYFNTEGFSKKLPLEIYVFDLNGRVVLRIARENDNTYEEISLIDSNLENGLYHLRVENSEKQMTIPFIFIK